MELSKRLDGIGEYYFSQKLKELQTLNQQGKAVINLGIGNPDLPPHTDVIAVLNDLSQKENVHGYQSYIGSEMLRNAFADWYRKWYEVVLDPATEILPMIGSKEGIIHVCMTYLNMGDKALIPNPGYPTYKSAVQLAGGVPLSYDLKEKNNWQINFEELEQTDLSGVKLMWVNYPHMPTGVLPTDSLFDNLIAFGKKHDILICHDNPYSFIQNEKPMSLLAAMGAKDVAIELNSLSKSHNMAGWRVGVLCGSAQRVSEVLRFKSNMDSGMFLPLQLAAAKALSLGQDWFSEVNTTYTKRKQQVYELLQLLNCTFSTNQAGLFVWAKVPENCKDGYTLSDRVLYNANVFVTPGGIFGTAGDNYIRISLCSNEQVFQTAIERIKQIAAT